MLKLMNFNCAIIIIAAICWQPPLILQLFTLPFKGHTIFIVFCMYFTNPAINNFLKLFLLNFLFTGMFNYV